MKNRHNLHLVILLSIFLGFTSFAKGQNLHTIIFANTLDPKIGESVLLDYNRISIEVNTIAAATGLNLKKYFYKDTSCSNANLRRVLERLQTNKDDVILFYYSGHGVRSKQDASEFPQMCLGSNQDKDFYPLESVLKKLENQPARLKLILGDCCNSYASWVNPKDDGSRNFTVLSKAPVNVYNNLFANTKGFLIASSSKKGETSGCNNLYGGFFTYFFLKALEHYASKGMETTWDKVMFTTKEVTLEALKGEQTPIYAVRVNQTATSNSTPYQEPQNTATGETSGSYEKIDILTAIGNEYFPTEKRVSLQETVLRTFFNSPNAKVEVVGSNGTTIVATEKASDFVLRLCTAHNLIKLAEVDYKLDENGKYKSLKVHEIYKK